MSRSPLMSHSLSRARLLRLAAAGTAALPALHIARGVAHDATPMASPVADAGSAPRMVRRNAKYLTVEEKKAFTDAVLAIKAMPSPWDSSLSIYDQFVVWHREAFTCGSMAAHMGPAFLPWHRVFLWLFEQQLQAVDPTVTVPYWDWTVDNETDSYLWQPDLMGGNGDPNDRYAVQDGPFRKDNWEVTVFDYTDDERLPFLIRNLGDGELAPDLPTAEQVETALAIPTYDVAPWTEATDHTVSFRSYMEGWRDCEPAACVDDPVDVDDQYPRCTGSHDMHNRVHLWVSGEMEFAHEGGHEAVVGPFGTMAMNSSPNDPVFYLHHANVDRIWSIWIRRHGRVYEPVTGGMPGHNLHDAMWPFSEIGMHITPAMVLDGRSVETVYDTD